MSCALNVEKVTKLKTLSKQAQRLPKLNMIDMVIGSVLRSFLTNFNEIFRGECKRA
jgi:hypothetical protein